MYESLGSTLQTQHLLSPPLADIKACKWFFVATFSLYSWNVSVPLAATQPQSMTDPSPCLTLGQVLFL